MYVCSALSNIVHVFNVPLAVGTCCQQAFGVFTIKSLKIKHSTNFHGSSYCFWGIEIS